MACSDYTDYTEALYDGGFTDFVICPGSDLIGQSLFALLVFGTIAIAFYIYSESVSLPLVIAIILGTIIGTIIVPTVPSRAIQILVFVFLFGAATAGTYFVRRAHGGS